METQKIKDHITCIEALSSIEFELQFVSANDWEDPAYVKIVIDNPVIPMPYAVAKCLKHSSRSSGPLKDAIDSINAHIKEVFGKLIAAHREEITKSL